MASVYGQKPTIELTFTAINNAAYVQLDSIKVMNRTQGGHNVLYWPDTTLTLGIIPGDTLLYIGYSTGFPVGVQEINQEFSSFHLFQSYPNPVKDHSIISIYIPENGIVSIMVNDIQGRVIVSNDQQMEKGVYSFRFSPGNSSLYFLSARWKDIIQSIKIINTNPDNGKQCMLDYTGNGNNSHYLKASLLINDMVMKQSGILDAPSINETYTFQFATNISCPGTPTVTYGEQVYNTIQIFSQCWLKEGLNVGTMIPGTQEMSNDSIIEKYCYNNNINNCNYYGGLYRWDEMMQYNSQQGVQGICPSGWHLPTDEEWKVLEGTVDSQYGIGNPEWDIDYRYRGYDAGTNLKSTSSWRDEGNGTDLFGFSGRPGGNYESSFFLLRSYWGYWWTSTESSNYLALSRSLRFNGPEVQGGSFPKGLGFSVRCLRDN